MTDPQDRLSRLTDSGKGPNLVAYWPIAAIVMVLGLAGWGYVMWSSANSQQAAETQGDASLAKPSADECAAAQALLTSLHAAGDDAKLAAGVGARQVRLATGANSLANVADAAGYMVLSPEETANSANMQPGDWRWCSGMGAFVRGLGLAPWSGDDDASLPALTLSRPAFNKAGTEAQMTEVFTPQTGYGAGLHDKGASFSAHRVNRIVTLTKGATGAWTVTTAKDIVPPKPADA